MDLWICDTWQVQSRMSVAELKTLVKRPDVVEVWVTNLAMCFQREKWSTGYLSCWLEVCLCSRGHHGIRSTIAGVFEGLDPKLLWNLTDCTDARLRHSRKMIWLDLLRFGWGGWHMICKYDVNTESSFWSLSCWSLLHRRTAIQLQYLDTGAVGSSYHNVI